MNTKPESNGNGRRVRESFAKIPAVIDIPNLIEIQLASYERFLLWDVKPEDRRPDDGLEGVFRSIFPISNSSESAILEYLGYEIGIWEAAGVEYEGLGGPGVVDDNGKEVFCRQKHEADECRQRGMTYVAPLRVLLRLTLYEKDEESKEKRVSEVKEQKVYLGEVPLMTDNGTFIINGTERVVVSQMHRSPGAFFSSDKSKTSSVSAFTARMIPARGSWLDFEFDSKDILYVRIDRRRKLPVTVLLRAFGLSMDDILNSFYQSEDILYDVKRKVFHKTINELMVNQRIFEDLVLPKTGELILKAGRKFTRAALRKLQAAGIETLDLKDEEVVGGIIAQPIADPETGEVLFETNQEITAEGLVTLREKNIAKIPLLYVSGVGADRTIRDTLTTDKCESTEDALVEIYKRLRPGDPPTKDTARNLFENLFFNAKRYDLSRIGRLKLNTKLGLNLPLDQRTLTLDDVIAVVRYIIELRHGQGATDDIDHLGNRRVRSVGELLESQFRLGLVRMERAIRERLSTQDLDTLSIRDLINSKMITAAIREFFGSSQLSQFMDQTNPLSEITHKRRLSALGPGGLTRDRAGFEVRDVHPTHYGRICPIETPEGPNIGLIASLSTYARVNEYGFIETPCQKIIGGRVSEEVEWLSAIDEDKYKIAQANAPVDEKGNLVNDMVSARTSGEFVLVPREQVDFMDVSPKQLVSVATSLIPFLENDDANRALMGSNMQRQAVPLLRTEAPRVGTGMEAIAARDSGAVVLSQADGEVVSADAARVVIRATGAKRDPRDPGVYIHNLVKYRRSNQNTCINQKPIVTLGQKVKKGEVIADGFSTDMGEIALGRNLLVAFMPWNGFNFEDAIVISERVVKEDIYTSIHIEEFEIQARDTKQGPEEITRDIPNQSEEALGNLDESGIIRVGARVLPGDVLVGRITPKGETQLSAEEKLLRAIFGEKAGDVSDSSLRVPPSNEGTIVEVRVFSRRGLPKDARTIAIEEEEIARLEKDYGDEVRIVREEGDTRLRSMLTGKALTGKLVDPETGESLGGRGTTITAKMVLALTGGQLLKVSVAKDVTGQMTEVHQRTEEQIRLLESILEEKISKLQKGDELPPGVLKMVKIYVAMKRKLQAGDKMAGRHGNKGVVSTIVPEEDMPYLEDGSPIDIILNPLGVPSRMNVGQILETNLGWAGERLGRHFATPVFDGALEEDIVRLMEEAKLPAYGKTELFDGRSGDLFEQAVTVGIIYMLKLHHLVDDKIHARSTGPYSLVTQQPLGGKAQFGGQRLGEMEVWALEAYGAAKTLQEILTVKSDDVAGRTRMYESIVKGDNILEANLPESFNVLMKELQSLALDIELIESGEAPR
ncbi:MAG TPA: DNA-directed RNA polymerase subunit beta [Nitrospinota bacterium]|jgi:DNA-directed RNA polymerase subunit beta|nr:DNA-directed RNA polymerase subunit beta [Nitrospinota bacterium]MDP7663236.1 DNA-directed RNA polymerase subunit beta [Nitrospinota bacterium]HJP14453.1 DNA-directed RNA polymerase subunit beta [Nitrospinota bacterium]